MSTLFNALDGTVPRALALRLAETPGRPFVTVEYEGTETYAQAHAQALNMAAALQTVGVTRGELVAVMAPNCLTAIHAWLGANLIGAVDVMLNGGYRGRTLEHALNLTRCKVLIADERFLRVLSESEQQLPHLQRILCFRLPDSPVAELPKFERIEVLDLAALCTQARVDSVPEEPGPRDLASIIFTSGTSGPAKGVMMPHAQAYLLALQTVQGLRLETRDTYYCFHPMYHTAGKFISLLAGIMSGAVVVLDRGFRADRWVAQIRAHGATVTLAHGAMLEMVYAQPPAAADADHCLERLVASPFPKRIAADFERRFKVRGIEAWGMTEVNNPCWCPFDGPRPTGACGRVNPEWAELRIVDPETDEDMPTGAVGEIVLRPRRPFTMMQGYFGMPEKTVEAWRNLWFHTGDGAYLDDAGWLHFVDRLGDRIRRRAENISSYEIESAAGAHAQVQECAAVGVPSGYESDDDIKLFVVPIPGARIDFKDLTAHLARSLPHYMVPRYIEILAFLPRTATNKVRKNELRSGAVSGKCWDRKLAGVALRDLLGEDGISQSNKEIEP